MIQTPPKTLEIPLATTREGHNGATAVDESDAKIDKVQIEVQEKSIYMDLYDLRDAEDVAYGDLTKSQKSMIYTVVHASMVGTPFLALVELKLLRRLTALRPKSRMMPRQMERALEDK